MIQKLISRFPELVEIWNNYRPLFKEKKYDSKKILLKEGEIAKKVFLIKEGCLRMFFYNKDKDVTFQFFFENEGVSSFESFRTGKPSHVYIETIEPSTLLELSKKDFEMLLQHYPVMKDFMFELIVQRMSSYSKLFLSFIKNTPRERYIELIKKQPRIIQRIPQHYIASYLGITSVSLSRIRKKI